MRKDYKERILSNGIKVYFYPDRNLKRLFVSYNIKYGSHGYFDKFYYQNKYYHVAPAMAHFLEHLLIETCPKGNMHLKFSDKNYDSNGCTYSEITTFYFVGSDTKDNLISSMQDLIEMVDCPKFMENGINEVKSAIIEELKIKGDNKYQIASANNRHNFFKNIDAVPVANNVLGSEESTNQITLNDVITSYNAYYNDENKFLVIGGNFKVDEMVLVLENIYKNIPTHKNELKPFDYGLDLSVRKEYEEIEWESDADYVITTYKIQNNFKMSDLLIDLYLNLYLTLKFKADTPFSERLIKEKIVNNGIYHSCDFFASTIAVTFSFESYKTKIALSEIEKELNLENLDREEFELLKKSMIVEELRKRDYIYRCFERLPLNIEFSTHLTEIDIIRKLDFDEMCKLMGDFNFSTKTTTVIKNRKTK